MWIAAPTALIMEMGIMNASENGDTASLEWIKPLWGGQELRRRGWRWSDGPAPGSFWALPEDGGDPVVVVEVARRHRYAARGRWFDPGERYEAASPAVAPRHSIKDGWRPWKTITLRRRDGVERLSPGPWTTWIREPGDRLVVDPLPEALYKSLSGEG